MGDVNVVRIVEDVKRGDVIVSPSGERFVAIAERLWSVMAVLTADLRVLKFLHQPSSAERNEGRDVIFENELGMILADGTVIHKDKYEENQALFDVDGTTIEKTRKTKTHKVTQYIMNGAEVIETNEHPGTIIPIIPVI